jgi:hypothetical protein
MARTKTKEQLLKTSSPNDSRIVPIVSQNITKEKLLTMLPKKTSIAVTDEIVAMINNIEEDTGLPQELIEEDIMSYTHLLGTGTNGMRELVNAIKFCNLKRVKTNKEAWSVVFPDKYDRLIGLNKPIDNHVAAYNGSKLVVAIDKEMLIPVHLQYAGYFHAAVKKQFDLMNGTSSQGTGKTTPMVEHLAAKELALLTAAPVDTKIDIKVGPNDAALDMQAEMNEQLRAIVASQRVRLESGEDITDVQAIGINYVDIERDRS